MNLSFSKYQGTGNDFIIMDNRKSLLHLTTEQIIFLCNRKFGIGADGLMLLEENKNYDFEMKYFNADGKEGSMCGNGGRCMIQFAFDNEIKKEHYTFLAVDGVHEGIIATENFVELKMQGVTNIDYRNDNTFVLNTGSPHFIQQVKNVDAINVYEQGKKIRYNDEFNAKGINVNFVEQIADNIIKVRTYERGVEDETLSCGTGVTAAALVFGESKTVLNTVQVQTKGGNLSVKFEKENNQSFKNIWLCGAATFVFKGEINML